MDAVKALKEIVQYYAEVLSDDKKLRAMLKDYFPEDKRTQNTLLMVADEGILNDMQGKNRINQTFGYIKRIVCDYGVSEMVAKTAVMNWAKALKIDVEDAPVNNENQRQQSRANVTSEIVDCSNVSSSEAIIKDKIIKLSGTGTKVFQGIVIPKGRYWVQATGGINAKYYDAANEFTFIIKSYVNEATRKEIFLPSTREKIFQTPSRIKFGVPGTLAVYSIYLNANWTLVLKPIG